MTTTNSGSRRELLAFVAGALVWLAAAILPLGINKTGLFTGYFLGLIAAVMHYMIIYFTRFLGHEQFLMIYYLSVFIRFAAILILFTTLLVLVNIEQISFTLSFIISYIFHSVIEIVLLHKKSVHRSC